MVVEGLAADEEGGEGAVGVAGHADVEEVEVVFKGGEQGGGDGVVGGEGAGVEFFDLVEDEVDVLHAIDGGVVVEGIGEVVEAVEDDGGVGAGVLGVDDDVAVGGPMGAPDAVDGAGGGETVGEDDDGGGLIEGGEVGGVVDADGELAGGGVGLGGGGGAGGGGGEGRGAGGRGGGVLVGAGGVGPDEVEGGDGVGAGVGFVGVGGVERAEEDEEGEQEEWSEAHGNSLKGECVWYYEVGGREVAWGGDSLRGEAICENGGGGWASNGKMLELRTQARESTFHFIWEET